MSIGRVFAAAAGVATLTGAMTAGAVSLNSSFFVSRFFTRGTTVQVMTPVDSTFCVLSQVSFNELDVAAETATCRVTPRNGVWFLEAELPNSGDQFAGCAATCVNL